MFERLRRKPPEPPQKGLIFSVGDTVQLDSAKTGDSWKHLRGHVGIVVQIEVMLRRQQNGTGTSYEMVLTNLPSGYVMVKFQLETGTHHLHWPETDLLRAGTLPAKA